MAVNVLVVDDSKLARINAGKALTQLQPEWRRIEAANAAQALEVVAAEEVDIALIDFNMEDKDGLALAAELREAYPNMPIAIITANIQDEIIARARALNASFVAKPLTSEGLQGFISGAALRLKSAGK
ncbi:response regulator transcription factor [Sphingosinicella sp. BN140058]|uniref:response regulator transcription factor n=1 Tax=Sphingosinicella sp. BN140058 TaxID=1892855 RepID=UPI001010F486|nr:response regulator [Sphingosinicella sp. BN140058]QAY75896.1 response regulator [Sphingosinicella sp. BN140058]